MSRKAGMRIQGSTALLFQKISLPVRKQKTKNKKKRPAPSCIRMPASYLAEFAIALPFFAGFCAMLLFFFPVLIVQQEVGNALLAAGRELSAAACGEREGELFDAALARVFFWKALGQDAAAGRFVEGGSLGISLGQSDFSGDFIRLQADYWMALPFGLFGKQEMHLTQRLVCRKWTGASESGGAGDDRIVYVTKNGSVYHISRDCIYLMPSVRAARTAQIPELRNQNGEKYYACETCVRSSNPAGGTAYITDYGNRYHSSRGCSRIWRTVFCIRLSEAAGKRACSRCTSYTREGT